MRHEFYPSNRKNGSPFHSHCEILAGTILRIRWGGAAFYSGNLGNLWTWECFGLSQALVEYGQELPYHKPCNEQSMVHASTGFARAKRRKATMACTTSIGLEQPT